MNTYVTKHSNTHKAPCQRAFLYIRFIYFVHSWVCRLPPCLGISVCGMVIFQYGLSQAERRTEESSCLHLWEMTPSLVRNCIKLHKSHPVPLSEKRSKCFSCKRPKLTVFLALLESLQQPREGLTRYRNEYGGMAYELTCDPRVLSKMQFSSVVCSSH